MNVEARSQSWCLPHFSFFETEFLCSPGCLETHSVEQAGLEFTLFNFLREAARYDLYGKSHNSPIVVI